MWNEIRRKLFHMTGIVYVVGLVYIPRPTYILILTVWVLTVLAIEQARLRMPSVRAFFDRIAVTLFREHEKQKLSGTFWMAEGVWITVMLLSAVPLAATAILYLLLGDSVASLAGQRLRGPKWPRSRKSISGSAACFAMCLIIGVALLRPLGYSWMVVAVGAFVATLVEALPLKFDDNVTIPVGSALALWICTR